MLKKFIRYNGSIALESLVTIAVMYFIVMNYLSFNTFLLQKREEQNQKLECYRILYEQIKLVRISRDFSSKRIEQEGTIYTVEFTEKNHSLIKVAISNGERTYEIKK